MALWSSRALWPSRDAIINQRQHEEAARRLCRNASACHVDRWHGEVQYVGTPLRLLQGHAARGCGSEDGKQKSRAHERRACAKELVESGRLCCDSCRRRYPYGKFEATGEATRTDPKFPCCYYPNDLV